KVDYIPSRFWLAERLNDYDLRINPNTGQPVNPLAVESLAYLQRLWPQLTAPGAPWALINPATNQRYNPSVPVPDFIDWNGNGNADGPVILEGDQCLVFFLGGIPIQGTPAGVLGFSTDPRDPSRVVDI